MKECLACGTNNNDENRFCSKCGASFSAIICPVCSSEVEKENKVCPSCGTDLTDYICRLEEIDRLDKLLDTDPELIKQNNKYIRLGIIRLIFGILSAINFALFYGSLEWGWSDSVGLFGFSTFLFTIILFVIFCIARGAKSKKIKRILREKSKIQ